jgi:3-hydroxyisobutyrate dehydrogenase
MADKKRIAFIGLGNMGGGMAARLTESGYPMTVWNRSAEKAKPIEELGATVASTPAEAAKDADVVMTSLANQAAVADVLWGDDGVFGSLKKGGYILDASTIPPDFARELSDKAKENGYKALDSCVYGAPMHARSGELRVMVGGEQEDFNAVEDILATIGGKELAYLGPSGLGATMKLVVNMLMGVQMPALAEAVVFGEKAGLPRDAILNMIAGSGYSSPVMSFRCPMMAKREFDKPAFRLSLMRKDMMFVLAESQRLGIPLPVSESAYAMLTGAEAQGLGDLDVAAIIAFQERISGMNDYPWPIEGADVS